MNAPTAFQAAMTNEFRAMLDRFVLVYLDDILVYSRILEDHLERLRRLLETLHCAKYKANHDKCKFVGQELEYLDYFVTPEGISPLSDKIQAIQEWPKLKTVTNVRSFLGLTGYYQRFIKGYSKIAAPLSKLQCEDRPFHFDDNARTSFLALKAALLSAEVLRIYDPLLPTRITTDASGYGIGVVLEQHDGVDWLFEYFSKKVPAMHSVDNARKDLLAFVHALKRWRHFLLGRRQFRWVTDNSPLVFYKTQNTVNSTIARWMAFIDQFDFFPDHIPGKSNRFVDALSRRPDHCTVVHSTFEINDDLRDNFIRDYQVDLEFCDKYSNCSSPNPAPSHYRIQEGYLFVYSRGKDLLCVPRDLHLRTQLLGEFHDAPATGYFGVNRTIGRLRERFWWPGLLDDITCYFESCEVCRRCKSRNHRPYGELRPLPVPLRRREAIAKDITDPFPKHKTGVDGILTVVDRLTKFAMFLPCRYHAKAPELAEVLYAGWIRTKGYPKDIVCSRDTRFMSDFWLAFIKRWGSSLKPSSARHPQSDGQTERAHQTAQVLLRTLIRPDQKDWVERLPDVELAYNSSIHPAIGMSPFEFEHGSPVTSPLDTIIPRMAESDDHLLFFYGMGGNSKGGGVKVCRRRFSIMSPHPLADQFPRVEAKDLPSVVVWPKEEDEMAEYVDNRRQPLLIKEREQCASTSCLDELSSPAGAFELDVDRCELSCEDQCLLSGGKATESELLDRARARKKLICAICLAFLFMVVEIVGGVLANSLAIMTDAAHLLSDVAGFAISLFSLWMVSWEATPRHSFGYHRMEILGALLSIQLIWMVTGVLIYEAVYRILNGNHQVEGFTMFLTSAFGVGVNMLQAVLLGHSHGHGTHSHGFGHDHHHHDSEHCHPHQNGNGVATALWQSSSTKGYAALHSDDQENSPIGGHGGACDTGMPCRRNRSKLKGMPRPYLASAEPESNNHAITGGDEGETVISVEQCGGAYPISDTADSMGDDVQSRWTTAAGRAVSDGPQVQQGAGHGGIAYSENGGPDDLAAAHSVTENINLKAAYVHVIGDMIQSIGVMLVGILIWLKPEWWKMDLVCTLLFSGLVLATTIKMLKDIIYVLMESTPKEIDATKVSAVFLFQLPPSPLPSALSWF
ncbi:hypothetical protein CBR_g22056 [Chara braunii]|uniref:Integrase catalytic domain-containing protein n=1 Tax=Chara braunii TaxID=69332 RepID=A0A388L222_CHABU|nr:hypothetical protein CBR_g22056 [Chara braunii]|eukprot:GBG76308.1 hypothetical protein CBR_g22056 [Chara braunii]